MSDFYLTIAPRGLESFVINNIKSQLESNGFSCWISEIGPSPLSKLHESLSSINTSGDLLNCVAARIGYNKYKKRCKKRKKGSRTNVTPTDTLEPPSQPIGFDDFLAQHPDLSRVIGSVDVPEIESHVSLGYHTARDGANSTLQRIIAVPGTLEGVALISFSTNATPIFVASIQGMGCGPFLALIASSCVQLPSGNKESKSNGSHQISSDCKVFHFDQTLEQSCSVIRDFFGKDDDGYFELFQSALELWHRHAVEVWYVPNSIYGDYKEHGREKCEKASTESTLPRSQWGSQSEKARSFSYRLSCVRTHSKRYLYKREELISSLGQCVIPWTRLHQIELGQNSGGRKNTAGNKEHTTSDWTVDLKDYDFEIVTIIHSGCMTLGIPLRPYQLLGSKAYSSNSIPSDGTGLFGRLGTTGARQRYDQNSFVHLRPSTADIMVSIADLHRHSVVLDPCAGIGTINIRAALQSHYGLGGELLPSLFQDQAPYFLDCNRKFQRIQRKGSGATDMAGWDATMLPVRDSVVDAVISDIPFGQKCLSHNELSAFMPGLLYECARVLVKNTGKMVLLCGDVELAISNLVSLNERSHRNSSNRTVSAVFHLPCESVFPVNISGTLAWIIVLRRGAGCPVNSPRYRTKPMKTISYAKY